MLLAQNRILTNDFGCLWHLIEKDVFDAVRRVGVSGHYILGPEVEMFEVALSEYSKSKMTVGCASGLDALQIALRCAGCGNGSKVITTPLSAFATTLAIVLTGATPVFVDVDCSGLLNLDLVQGVLETDSTINGIVPVHLYGHVLDLGKLNFLKSKYSIFVVEDCAQAIGATWSGTPVGSVSNAAALSFYPTKNLGALGDGGAILVQNVEMRDYCSALRDYGQVAKYDHRYLGLNSRLDELQAAILRTALLPHLSEWTERRRAIARQYQQGILNDLVTIPSVSISSDSVWHLFPILVRHPYREVLQNFLRDHAISTGLHYPFIIPEVGALQQGTLYEIRTALTYAERFANEELSLPIHPFLEQAEVASIIDAINSWKI